MNKKDKIILFLGNADSEASTAKLKATNRLYKRKMLESGIENWSSIISYFDDYSVTCVVTKLTKSSFNALASSNYSHVANELLTRVSKVPNLILAHESLLTGVQSRQYERQESPTEDYDQFFDIHEEYLEHDFNEMFSPPSNEVIERVKKTISEYGMKVIPYKKNVELSILASSFIEQNEHNLIFRIYVPSEKIWANEAEKLLQLFRGYLQKASGLNARHDQYKTNNGVVHEFFGDDEVATSSLTEKFQEFSSFMDACVSDPELARKSLESSNLNNRDVLELVSKYSREARRLHIDLKHERERKLLNIRQDLEADLSEYVRDSNDWDVLYKIVENSIPKITGVSTALDNHIGVNSVQPMQNVYINSQIIEKVSGVVAKEISGTINLAPEAKELLKAIEQYGESNKSELTSAVHELTDKNVKEKDRITAKQNLKGFLIATGAKIGDVSTGILQSFIESQIGL